ncbi:MAG: helix-turn-helix transcriptional regulator [Chloroflexi bacterium]|nr:MAG: helix-turn-helix transcriptional regulator [Chloroflexota bacterium]
MGRWCAGPPPSPSCGCRRASPRARSRCAAARADNIHPEQMTFAHSETAEHVRTTIGAILRRRRESAERSLQEVAGPAGISPAFLSEVERGRKEISVERLLKVCAALETTIGEVYLELARELGAGEPLNAVAWEADPRLQLRLFEVT